LLNAHYTSPLNNGLGWAIFLLAFVLRWPSSSPEWSHVHERAFVLYPLIFWGGDFNPHFFNYPTFTLYVISALYYIYYLLFSAQAVEYFVAYRYFVDPNDLLAIARTTNTLVSAATVAVCMTTAGRLYGRTGGYLAGVVLAVMPLHARFAHLAITDVAAGFFTALAVLYGVRIVQQQQRGDMVLAGVCVGLTAASKYPAGLALMPVLGRNWRENATWTSLALLAVPVITSGLIFVMASPFVLLDWPGFWASFEEMAGEHLLDDIHATDDPAWYYWMRHNFRYGLGWAGLLVLTVSLGWPTIGRRREEWVVVVGAVVFLLLLFSASPVFMRYAQPLAPLLAILLARSGRALASRRS
jgi:4-amino-4-deoxy-L-arabinose transferase-like glycosyltransferase